jgi:hypothetical protein
MHGLGAEAVSSLMTDLRQDIEHQLGSTLFVAAALERLDARCRRLACANRIQRALDSNPSSACSTASVTSSASLSCGRCPLGVPS